MMFPVGTVEVTSGSTTWWLWSSTLEYGGVREYAFLIQTQEGARYLCPQENMLTSKTMDVA